MPYPFECIGPDGKTHFHFQEWGKFVAKLFNQYPIKTGHQRAEIELIFPCAALHEVYCHWSPFTGQEIHSNPAADLRGAWACHCIDADWSLIFDAYPSYSVPGDPNGSCRFLAEKGHKNPLGEKLVLMSTATMLNNDHANRFAFFRGKYWKVLSYKNWHDITAARFFGSGSASDQYVREYKEILKKEQAEYNLRIEMAKEVGEVWEDI